mmetsp:Transcript_19546/g.60249  ORF Transcript_19546/g.60249 Transcript_19546/m.60249 type:complete len:796 (-) Transcript_19546:24-2411(-)
MERDRIFVAGGSPEAPETARPALAERRLSFAGPHRVAPTRSIDLAEVVEAANLVIDDEASTVTSVAQRAAGVLVSALLNVMLCVPFAMNFFPIEWEPFPLPRAVGCSMYFLSTFIVQVVLTWSSGFEAARGQMMVENIPFMHAIAFVAMDKQGLGEDALGTVLITWALGTLFVGAAFYTLGALDVGNVVHHIPRHVIVGCIGGIGVFLVRTSFEVSTAEPFDLRRLCRAEVVPLWSLAVAYAAGLRLSIWAYGERVGPLLTPAYVCSILPSFYLLILFAGATVDGAREAGWLFPLIPDVSPFAPLELILQTIQTGGFSWRVFFVSLPTTVLLAIFALMHVPINIPALAATVNESYDLSHELKLHGVANLASGLVGGLPNYLGYCVSVMYAKSGGGGKPAGVALICLDALAVFYGIRIVPYVPRVLAGCLILHVGLDLVKEALYDSFDAFDMIEYSCILLIVGVMTFKSFEAGLLIAFIGAAFAFVFQQALHGDPVRRAMTGAALRSSRWRSKDDRAELDESMRNVLVMQIVGTLFFGNAVDLKDRVSRELSDAPKPVQVLILDFTLVRSIDSSAVEVVGSDICAVARRHGARLCFASGRVEGFPCAAPLTTKLSGDHATVVTDLDAAMEFAENCMLASYIGDWKDKDESEPTLAPPAAQLAAQLSLSREDLDALAARFCRAKLEPGEVLWRQDDKADSIVVVYQGSLLSSVDDDAVEVLGPGLLVGGCAALTTGRRASTIACAGDEATIYVLDAAGLASLDASVVLELALATMRYMHRRLDHPSNHLYGTRRLPL